MSCRSGGDGRIQKEFHRYDFFPPDEKIRTSVDEDTTPAAADADSLVYSNITEDLNNTTITTLQLSDYGYDLVDIAHAHHCLPPAPVAVLTEEDDDTDASSTGAVKLSNTHKKQVKQQQQQQQQQQQPSPSLPPPPPSSRKKKRTASSTSSTSSSRRRSNTISSSTSKATVGAVASTIRRRTTLPLLEDVCILVGGQVFWQSSAILQYASPVLAQHLIPAIKEDDDDEQQHYDNGNDGVVTDENRHHNTTKTTTHTTSPTFLLKLSPHIPSSEWRLLEPFLQPHSRQAAVLTPKHLILLKWFLELDLTVLLQQSDNILCQVLLNSWSLEKNHDCGYSLQELLTLSHIAREAKLSKTSQQVWLAWNRVLLPVPSLQDPDLQLDQSVQDREQQEKQSASSASLEVNNDGGGNNNSSAGCVLAHDLENLQALIELLAQWPEARPSLWLALIRYLPADLEVYTDQQALLQNPLLPYLLREGMQRDAAAADEKRKKESGQTHRGGKKRSTAEKFPAVSSPGSNAGTTASAPPRLMSNKAAPSSSEDWQSSVQEWLVSWLISAKDDANELASVCHRSSTRYCRETLDASIGMMNPEASSSSLQSELLAQVPNNRNEWLELIWRKLQGPPILPALPVTSTPTTTPPPSPLSSKRRTSRPASPKRRLKNKNTNKSTTAPPSPSSSSKRRSSRLASTKQSSSNDNNDKTPPRRSSSTSPSRRRRTRSASASSPARTASTTSTGATNIDSNTTTPPRLSSSASPSRSRPTNTAAAPSPARTASTTNTGTTNTTTTTTTVKTSSNSPPSTPPSRISSSRTVMSASSSTNAFIMSSTMNYNYETSGTLNAHHMSSPLYHYNYETSSTLSSTSSSSECHQRPLLIDREPDAAAATSIVSTRTFYC